MKKTTSNIPFKVQNEWLIMISGCILSLILIYLLTFHLSHITTPIQYRSDNSSMLFFIQKLHEGWINHNMRSGYPLGSNMLDYPVPEAMQLFFLKIISLFSFSNILTFNIFYILSYFICFACSFIILRTFELNIVFAYCCALLYNFAPFHFLRINHLFYTWYFVAPLYIGLAYRLYFQDKYKPEHIICHLIGLIILGTTGIYYALFGIITITTSLICKLTKNFSINVIKQGTLINLGIISGILLASTPYVVHKFTDTPNPIAVSRSVVESELYGFKMVQLLLPQDKHHAQKLRNIKTYYNQAFFLNNENTTSSLGLIAAIGFILAFISIFLKLCDVSIDPKIQFFSILTLIYFLFGMIGGLGTIFATFITPLIRCWNRISIFINFTCLIIFFLYLQKLLSYLYDKYNFKITKFSFAFSSIVLLTLGLYDQTPHGLHSEVLESQKLYKTDKNFIESIERQMTPNSAIYQLPYMQFPEVPNLYQLESYDLLSGFIYSKNLKWSYGGMKGRDGDLFYQNLAKKPLSKQINTIRKMGMTGIYVDLRGYEDHGKKINNELTKLLGPALLRREDNNVLFFKL